MEPHLHIKASERHCDCSEYVQDAKMERSLRRVLNRIIIIIIIIILQFLFVNETSQQSNGQLQKQQNTNTYNKEQETGLITYSME